MHINDALAKVTVTLLNDEILYRSELKAFAGNKINGPQKLKLVLRKVENIVVKGENAGCQHFLLFPQRFQKSFSLTVLNSRNCGVKGYPIPTQ